LESDLSALGIAQARALGRRLAARSLAAIYSSPLSRAVRTAELVGEEKEHAPAVRGAGELVEIDHGEWSGLSRAQVERRWPELSRRWQTEPGAVEMPKGESLREVRARALSFLARVRQEHAGGNILIITHGTVLRLMVAHFLEMAPDQIWSIQAENCALSIVDDYDVPLVMAINDTCHLDGVRSSLHAQVR
jgi:broad specificity phosphatase PhoE